MFAGKDTTRNMEYIHKLLTKETIRDLRNKSTIICKKPDDETADYACDPLKAPCLFNIREDPCEFMNRAYDRPIILKSLENALEQIRKTVVPASNQPNDLNADPKNWENVWECWQDAQVIAAEVDVFGLSSTSVAVLAVLCSLFFVVVMILIGISVKTAAMKKPNNNADLFAIHNEGMDAPTDVINVITNLPEHSKQNS